MNLYDILSTVLILVVTWTLISWFYNFMEIWKKLTNNQVKLTNRTSLCKFEPISWKSGFAPISSAQFNYYPVIICDPALFEASWSG